MLDRVISAFVVIAGSLFLLVKGLATYQRWTAGLPSALHWAELLAIGIAAIFVIKEGTKLVGLRKDVNSRKSSVHEEATFQRNRIASLGIARLALLFFLACSIPIALRILATGRTPRSFAANDWAAIALVELIIVIYVFVKLFQGRSKKKIVD